MIESKRLWNNGFQIVLESLDTPFEEQVDSPVYFNFNQRNCDQLRSSTNSSDWWNKEIEISQFLSSSEGSPRSSSDRRISTLIDRLWLRPHFKEIQLSPEEVYIFKYMYEEARQKFEITKWAVFLAFNVFLQYKSKCETDNIIAAISSLLLAWKFKDVVYNVPFIDDLIDHSKKSVFLNNKSNLITFQDIKNTEVKIAMTLDWNLMQTTLFEVCYWLLKHESDFQIWEEIILSNILEKSSYSLPIKFVGYKDLTSNKNYQVEKHLLKPAPKQNIEIKRKPTHRK